MYGIGTIKRQNEAKQAPKKTDQSLQVAQTASSKELLQKSLQRLRRQVG